MRHTSQWSWDPSPQCSPYRFGDCRLRTQLTSRFSNLALYQIHSSMSTFCKLFDSFFHCLPWQFWHFYFSISFHVVTLKIKQSIILPAKMSLFRNSRELHFRTCNLWQNHGQVQRTKDRNTLSERTYPVEKRCYKQNIHWNKLGVPSVWLLIGWAVEEETQIFHPPAGSEVALAWPASVTSGRFPCINFHSVNHHFLQTSESHPSNVLSLSCEVLARVYTLELQKSDSYWLILPCSTFMIQSCLAPQIPSYTYSPSSCQDINMPCLVLKALWVKVLTQGRTGGQPVSS